MKEYKYKDLVKFPKKPLEIYEVVAVRNYKISSPEGQPDQEIKVLLIWGINTNASMSVTEDQVVGATAYWEYDENLPFEDITVPNKIKTKEKKETKKEQVN